jgi:hypothetical protein
VVHIFIMNHRMSAFEKWIGRPRPWHHTVGFAILLFAIALAVGVVEHGANDLLQDGRWQDIFRAPSLIVYTLVVAPLFSQLESKVFNSLSPLSQLDRPSADRLKNQRQSSPHRELGAIAVGCLVGIIVIAGTAMGASPLLALYLLVSTAALCGLLAWTLYISTLSVDWLGTLLKQPLHVNLFNLRQFDVIGRQSLFLALAFVGGITISLLFVTMDLSLVQGLDFWLIYLPLFFVPIAIFFWNMYPTHQLLESARDEELAQVRERLPVLSRRVVESAHREPVPPGAELTLLSLLAYEARIQQVRTWPYDVGMLILQRDFH